MGLTFAGDPTQGRTVTLTVTAARYRQIASEPDERWVREEVAPDPIEIDLTVPANRDVELVPGLDLRIVVRQADDEVVAVTVALVNSAVAEPGDKDGACWFRPCITVSAPEGVLCARRETVVAGLDDDEVKAQHLLFSDVKSYAIGHGCAVEWDDAQATSISTTFLPRHELLLSDPGGLDSVDLRMTHLADSTTFGELESLVEDYRRWIDGLSDDDLSADDSNALDRHKTEAGAAADRMLRGINLLRTNDDVRQAFRLMNLAMAQQRSRQEFHRNGGIGDPSQADVEKAGWRPFQIAFILVNLEGLAVADSAERELADLLWFPTGGGKTEAYLGLVAISIMLRRIRDPKAAGVSVLMRYTLRLLTLQQYQRATGLICALEDLRLRELPTTKPISIGLWVGQASTPNKLEDANRALRRANRHNPADDVEDAADPVQLRQCPWCGTELTHKQYKVAYGRMTVSCRNTGCRFHNELPVWIVDEDVYRERPSLLIGTVDKFAMMPWKRDVGNLFGTEGSTTGSHADPPPDLIVQDELHLISGPLGTVVGLYETAVDAACSRPHRPKVVASTATIRRATDQVRAVFAREARQFPPPGRTYRHSYFAVEAPKEVKGSREYVGVMGAGTSHTTVMVRVYASLLQSAAAVGADDETADLYWTLLGYFNSLRVLGGAFIQVIDDVPMEMQVIANRRGEDRRELADPREMTSRKKSSEIPEELKILEKQRGEVDAADTVLATNMISVGVDVDRLGLMAVMGQPQTTAEYIQATSRVGRRMPGLVVTMFNAARSRDLSHYENFAGYHRMLYRHVEATGATPFAPRARDRALHGVLVSMARLTIKAAAPDQAAGKIEDWKQELEHCVDEIVRRVDVVRSGSSYSPDDESPDKVRDELDELIGNWMNDAYKIDHYPGWFDKRVGALIQEASRAVSADDDVSPNFPVTETPWPTLTSMRDVDAESTLFFVRTRGRSSRER